MKKIPAGILLTLALSMSTGCRSASIARRTGSDTTDTTAHVARNDNAQRSQSVSSVTAKLADDEGNDIQQTSAESSDAGMASVTPAANTYSVRAAIETALAQNPDLIALRQAEGVGSAALGVAQTYPFNPFVQVQATPYQQAQNGNGPGTTYHYVLLMQQIQLGNQQQFREDAACATLNQIRWNVLQAELLNVAQTERLYFAAVYQQGLRDLAKVIADNNQELLTILERQFEAREATAADVAIVRIDARSTRQQLRITEANLQTALLDLKRHLCLAPETPVVLDDSVMQWNWQPVTEAQLTSVAMNRPDVLAARADVDTARANTNLANGSRIPDVQLGPYYQRTDSGITFLGFRAQMDLPIINNGVPLLRQREAELVQRATTAQQLATRAHLEAAAAADRYERARQLRGDTADSPHVSVPDALQRMEELFKQNEVDILRVLQARTSLLQSQRADLDALNELMQAAVAVTASSGTPLESLTSTSAIPPAAPME